MNCGGVIEYPSCLRHTSLKLGLPRGYTNIRPSITRDDSTLVALPLLALSSSVARPKRFSEAPESTPCPSDHSETIHHATIQPLQLDKRSHQRVERIRVSAGYAIVSPSNFQTIVTNILIPISPFDHARCRCSTTCNHDSTNRI
jgi:hypothetical protein